MRYGDGGAFRQALEQRLKTRAGENGARLARDRKRVAFDRLLARLATIAPNSWLLKGGFALDLRLAKQARPGRTSTSTGKPPRQSFSGPRSGSRPNADSRASRDLIRPADLDRMVDPYLQSSDHAKLSALISGSDRRYVGFAIYGQEAETPALQGLRTF